MKLNIESKKEQLKRMVLEDLRTGFYKVGERLPPEREFTERFQISRITVKAALNDLAAQGMLRRRKGSGTYVSEIPSPEPVAPDEIRTRVGFVLHHQWNNHVAFANFFRRFGERQSPSVQTKVYFHNYFRKSDYERDGLDTIAVDMLFDERSLRELKDADFRVIRLFQEWPTGEYVCPNSSLGGYLQGRSLAAAGHRKVATFQFTEDRTVEFKERFDGLQQACEETGMELERVSLARDVDIADIGQALDYLFAVRDDITAFVCCFEAMALRLLDALEARGARIPEDYSVISIDDYYSTRLLSPPLTTFRVPWEEMAEALAENLNALPSSKTLPLRMTFPPVYVAGGSVKTLSPAISHEEV